MARDSAASGPSPPTPTPAAAAHPYAAFISYRHAPHDRRWAKWLHRALETYRVPAGVRRDRGVPARVGRVFRDEEELPASADPTLEIDPAVPLTQESGGTGGGT